MVRKIFRIYADTSVFGGVFDTEFDTVSLRFFHHVKNKDFHLVTSVVVAEELKNAPNKVRNFLEEVASCAELTDISQESLQLQQAYLKAGIVSPKSATDALHVALVNRF